MRTVLHNVSEQFVVFIDENSQVLWVQCQFVPYRCVPERIRIQHFRLDTDPDPDPIRIQSGSNPDPIRIQSDPGF
jgi:hypothetical protein